MAVTTQARLLVRTCMTGAKRWMIWILPDTDWQAWRSQPGTLQNLGRDDLEVFDTIKRSIWLGNKKLL